MKVVVLHNPRSGRGLASRLSGRVVGALLERGHAVKSLRVGDDEPIDQQKLATADSFIIVGGDGSVGFQIVAACASGTPVYHVGTGNENLFARHFKMRRDPVAVVRAVEAQNRARIDLGRVNGEPMLLMLGTGCDAGVIRRFETRRTRAIGHLAYIEPVVREGLRPSIRPVSVWVDDELVLENRAGQLLIANCPAYASGSDPARNARMDDGFLDLVFMPSTTSVAASVWLAAARLRLADRLPGWVEARGREVRVEWSDSPGPVQIDGEWARRLDGDGFVVSVEPVALPVLLPG